MWHKNIFVPSWLVCCARCREDPAVFSFQGAQKSAHQALWHYRALACFSLLAFSKEVMAKSSPQILRYDIGNCCKMLLISDKITWKTASENRVQPYAPLCGSSGCSLLWHDTASVRCWMVRAGYGRTWGIRVSNMTEAGRQDSSQGSTKSKACR